MQSPHVVYIITKLELGGAQKVCLSLFEDLSKTGITTSLISGTQGPLVCHVEKNPNAHLLTSLTREVKTSGIIAELRCMKDLIAQLRTLKKKYPDLIVHTHSTKAGLLGRWAAFFAGIRTRIHTVHGYGFHPHQNALAWYTIYFFELITSVITTHFICVSHADVATGIRLFPRFMHKYSLIRAAVTIPDTYLPAHKISHTDTDLFIIGTVACFKPQKNLFDLLRAFAYVYQRDQRARLEIIGDGTLRPTLEAWIAQHKLTSVITLHGWQHDVARIMHRWHAFALTSLWEGLPCAIIEARLLKLPVLSYDTGGIREVIHHGNNGFLYPQHAWRNLGDGILTIMHDTDVYTRMQTYNDSLDDFFVENMVHHHQKLYRSLHVR